MRDSGVVLKKGAIVIRRCGVLERFEFPAGFVKPFLGIIRAGVARTRHGLAAEALQIDQQVSSLIENFNVPFGKPGTHADGAGMDPDHFARRCEKPQPLQKNRQHHLHRQRVCGGNAKAVDMKTRVQQRRVDGIILRVFLQLGRQADAAERLAVPPPDAFDLPEQRAVRQPYDFIAGVNLLGNLTGTAETLSVIPVFVLLALVLAGLVVVVVDTARLHRADAAVRVSAKGNVSHYPLYAHAHRYPPRHRGSWVFVIVMLVAMTGITVFILPAEVNSWAYVVGAEHHDTFNPEAGEATS